MEIILKRTNKNSKNNNIVLWLNQFKDISDSLLLELDLKEKAFIAKSFTTDKSLVKYSRFDLEKDGNFDIEIPKDANLDKLVKIGIFMLLDKVIEVFNTFTPVDYTLSLTCKLHSELDCYETSVMKFVSDILVMNIKGASISEFQDISDDMFMNSIYSCEDPIEVILSKDTVKNILAVSSILSMEKDREMIAFYPHQEENGLWVLHATKPTQHTYDFAVGEIINSTGLNENIEIVIYRGKFQLALKNLDTNVKLSLPSSNGNRILMDINDQWITKTVLSTVIF